MTLYVTVNSNPVVGGTVDMPRLKIPRLATPTPSTGVQFAPF